LHLPTSFRGEQTADEAGEFSLRQSFQVIVRL
jgi:hypothetical protein